MRDASDWCKKNANGDNGLVTAAALPRFELASVDGSPVRFDEVIAGEVAVVLFVTEECPTCAMTLRRFAAPPLSQVRVYGRPDQRVLKQGRRRSADGRV